MLSLYRKYWRTAFDLAVLVFTVWLIMYVFSFLYKIAAPVFLSILIFLCIEPLARRLHRLGIKKAIAAGISMLVFLAVIIVVISGLGFIFYRQLAQIAADLPVYQEILTREFAKIAADLQERYNALPPEWTGKLSEAVDNITKWGSELAAYLLNWLVQSFKSVTSFVFNFLIALILAYFLSLEIDRWKKFGAQRMPKTLKTAFSFLKENVFKGIVTFLKAQAILISVTFLVIFVVLTLLGVPNAFAIALIAGIFDLLPLLGVQTLFIPWIIYLFIVGDNTLAIWLTVLLVTVNVTRQFLEPRITGQTIGVSAFTMLAFAIISLSLFGVAGLILAPILMILLKALYDQGYLHRWIRLPEDEFAISPLDPQPLDDRKPEGPGGANAP